MIDDIQKQAIKRAGEYLEKKTRQAQHRDLAFAFGLCLLVIMTCVLL